MKDKLEEILDDTTLKNEDSKENYDPYSLYESDEDGDIIYPLTKPFTKTVPGSGKNKSKSEEVTTICVRAPNGSDLRATADMGPQAAAYLQVQRCARLKPAGFDQLSAKDIMEINNIVNFLA